jgi:YHS domain-containing protein
LNTDDGPVYFCCKGCAAKYKANPAKYAEKVAAQRKFLAEHP